MGTFALVLVPGFAAMGNTGHDHGIPANPPTTKKVVSGICQVREEKISDVSKAPAKSVYKGKTYYFCCMECKPRFDKNPGKYIKNARK